MTFIETFGHSLQRFELPAVQAGQWQLTFMQTAGNWKIEAKDFKEHHVFVLIDTGRNMGIWNFRTHYARPFLIECKQNALTITHPYNRHLYTGFAERTANFMYWNVCQLGQPDTEWNLEFMRVKHSVKTDTGILEAQEASSLYIAHDNDSSKNPPPDV